jgi:hypothetical protein
MPHSILEHGPGLLALAGDCGTLATSRCSQARPVSPRWWNTPQAHHHAVGLHLRHLGEWSAE